MSELDIILGFIGSCVRGNLGFSECSPVFVIGGIALAVVILGITLAAMVRGQAKSQSTRQDGP